MVILTVLLVGVASLATLIGVLNLVQAVRSEPLVVNDEVVSDAALTITGLVALGMAALGLALVFAVRQGRAWARLPLLGYAGLCVAWGFFTFPIGVLIAGAGIGVLFLSRSLQGWWR